MSNGQSARRASRLAPVSAYWDADEPVLAHHHLPEGRAVPSFGDHDRWDLGALGWNPAAGRHSAVLLFDAFIDEWNLRARELTMAMLNPGHKALRDRSLYLSATPAHVKTIRVRLEGLKRYASWHAEQLGDIPLRELKQSHLDHSSSINSSRPLPPQPSDQPSTRCALSIGMRGSSPAAESPSARGATRPPSHSAGRSSVTS